MSTILKTDNMTMRFGGVTAVCQLKLEIPEHKIVALIGYLMALAKLLLLI